MVGGGINNTWMLYEKYSGQLNVVVKPRSL